MTLNNFARAGVLALALSGASLLSSGAVAADVPDDVPSVTVLYGDLNLERTEGVTALYVRLRTAAVVVCRSRERGGPFTQLITHACIQKALANAVAKVDNPTLTAYYRARTPGEAKPAVVTAKN